MSGLERNTPIPTEIRLHQKSHFLEIGFSDGTTFKLPYEFLRVYSPSAEVRGHGKGQEVLQTGKRDVTITGIEPVGNYAVKPIFSDGHVSGIYSWDLLYDLGSNFEALWLQYLGRIAEAHASRDPSVSSVDQAKPDSGSCGSSKGACGHTH
jgi:DUF971 family protein